MTFEGSMRGTFRTTTGNAHLPTAVLLHGVGGNARNFSRLQDHLEGQVRTVAYTREAALNRRGRCTLEPLLEELVGVLGHVGCDEDVVAVGHSWGGALARAFATRHAERVRGVVLLDATHEHLAGVRGLTFRALALMAGLVAQGPCSSTRRAVAMRELAGIPPSLRALRWPDQPVLVVIGGHGVTARQRRVREDMRSTYAALARQLPAIQLVTLPQAGHWIAEDEPAATAALIHQFAIDTTRRASETSAS